jgi:hypothetical protein
MHVLIRERVKLDPKKLQAIKDWKILIMAKKIWSFLGLASKTIRWHDTMALLDVELIQSQDGTM